MKPFSFQEALEVRRWLVRRFLRRRGADSGPVAHGGVTGEEMIVWGGGDTVTNYGARYDPVGDSWTATSQGTNCPGARAHHTAVWTDSEMIIWGGGGSGTNTGGRYDPSDNTWETTSTGAGCPSNRIGHTACGPEIK